MSEECELPDVDQARLAEASRHLLSDELAAELAETFKMLADPNRVRLVSLLAGMELCVGELAVVLGMSMSAVSHQLRLLRELRLVKARREGRHMYYSLDDDHITLIYHHGIDHVLHGPRAIRGQVVRDEHASTSSHGSMVRPRG
ncbi:MAG: helix-turn-helix transcriptional regulator [Chloroflexi bacterium]|nr:helix-turn-helix transcriptional regulator [Chloroflexota bacterium]